MRISRRTGLCDECGQKVELEAEHDGTWKYYVCIQCYTVVEEEDMDEVVDPDEVDWYE